jgi:hypothetical protein
VRTILATIGLVLATAFLLYIVIHTRRVLTWIVIAAFLAVAVSPLVDRVQRRLVRGRRRTLATFVVFLLVVLAGGEVRRPAAATDRGRAGRPGAGRQAAGTHQRVAVGAGQPGSDR